MARPGERFAHPIDIQPSDIDDLGHVNNVVYVRWVQEAAIAHWRADAEPQDQLDYFWVVARHEIDYMRSAHLGDAITAHTWVGAATRSAFERYTELTRGSDGEIVARARTIWCPIDPKTFAPVDVRASVRERFSVTDEEEKKPRRG